MHRKKNRIQPAYTAIKIMNKPYDILIKNTSIIDGTGKPAYKGSIGICGDKIAAIGNLQESATTVIDGEGLITCPGFIDPHSHADRAILEDSAADNLIMQGITTFVGGHCGNSPAPAAGAGAQAGKEWKTFGEFLECVRQNGLTPNYAPLIGHNAIRRSVLGEYYARKATLPEIDAQKNILREALASGCFGLSIGLDGGMAGHFADIEELVELARIVREYDGIFAPHTRHHQNQWPATEPGECAYGIFDAPAGEILTGRYHGLLEAVEISRMAGNARLHLSHITPAYLVPQPHPPALDEALARATIEDIVEKAEASGMDISYNVIPSDNSIAGKQRIIEAFFSKRQNLPKWIRDLEPQAFASNLKDPAFRAKTKNLMLSGKMKIFMIHPVSDPYWAECYMILNCSNKACQGRTLWEIAREREPAYTIKAVYEECFNVLFDVLTEDWQATWTLVKDKREYGAFHVFLNHRLGVPCTDYVPPAKTNQLVSNFGLAPSLCNMFLAYLVAMVRDKKLLLLEEAVRKVTTFPAQKLFGLKDRGVLKENAFADIVIMDFEKLQIRNDYDHPKQPTPGMKFVMVNGKIAYENGVTTGVQSGRVLSRT